MLEDLVTSSRKETPTSRAYAAPLFWVAVLMVCYWLLAEWPELPKLIGELKAGLHWPG
jgi:hypothetical protein